MKSSQRRPWRLVLSGGATGGVYWMAGALEAISGAGLDPVSAELIVGTSAGVLVGTVAALGARPWDLVGNSPSEPGGGPMADRTARRAAQGRARDFLRHRLIPHMGVRISAAIASLIPAGTHSTDHIAGLVRDLLDMGAKPHRGLRISTVDRLSASRVVFGPDPESLPQAVAAPAPSRAGLSRWRSTAPTTSTVGCTETSASTWPPMFTAPALPCSAR